MNAFSLFFFSNLFVIISHFSITIPQSKVGKTRPKVDLLKIKLRSKRSVVLAQTKFIVSIRCINICRYPVEGSEEI